jgi:hypothetical protein
MNTHTHTHDDKCAQGCECSLSLLLLKSAGFKRGLPRTRVKLWDSSHCLSRSVVPKWERRGPSGRPPAAWAGACPMHVGHAR